MMLLPPKQSVDRTPEYYENHVAAAFRDGFYQRLKVKRHMTTKYDRYHYYLPAKLSPVIRFLKRYFATLDAEYGGLDEEHRYRQTPFEFSETAIRLLDKVRMRISVNQPIYVGTSYFGPPISWGLFGNNVEGRSARKQFLSLKEVLDYYSGRIQGRGFNAIKIDRPHKMAQIDDKLLMLSQRHDRSANLMLACGLCLLYDLIIHCGPDCDEFHEVFTNDRRLTNKPQDAWVIARQSVISPGCVDLGEILVRGRGGPLITTQSYPGGIQADNYKKRNNNFCRWPRHASRVPSYFEVEISDVFAESHADLVSGENVALYEDLLPRKPKIVNNKPPEKPKEDDWQRRHGNPYGYFPNGSPSGDGYQITLEDVDSNTETEELDAEYRRIISDREERAEMLRGWSGI